MTLNSQKKKKYENKQKVKNLWSLTGICSSTRKSKKSENF